MPIPTRLRTVAFFALSASLGAGAVVMAPLYAQGIGAVRSEPTLVAPVVPNDPQIKLLQAQVASLQAQLTTLAAAIQVTSTGVVLRGPTVTIAGDTIRLGSAGDLYLQANNLRVRATVAATLQAGGTASLEASGTLGLKGSTIQLNGSTRPVAVVGSMVLGSVPSAGAPFTGQIQTGSTSVYTN